MDKATELINSLSEEEIAAYAASSSGEPHIVIGRDRIITVPDALKKIGVQFDHEVEVLVFDCPRYWNGIDLARDTEPMFTFYINYTVDGKISNKYTVTDVSIDADDADTIHFSWPVSRDMTQIAGAITFSVCCKENVDEEFVTRWNSEKCVNGLTISNGLECMETMLSSYPEVMDKVELTSERIDASFGDIMDKRINTMKANQDQMELDIKNNASALAAEETACKDGDEDISDMINAEEANREAADEDISKQTENLNIDIDKLADEAVRDAINKALPDADFSVTDAADEQPSIKSIEFKQVYRPYMFMYTEHANITGSTVTYWRLSPIRETIWRKCISGLVTIYTDDSFHISGTLQIIPGEKFSTANGNMINADWVSDMITREDLSRLMFGDNRASFTIDPNGVWFPADDATSNYLRSNFEAGFFRIHTPTYAPALDGATSQVMDASKSAGCCYIPKRTVPNEPLSDTQDWIGKFYQSIETKYRLNPTNAAPFAPNDFFHNEGEDPKHVRIRFELRGKISGRTTFNPYSEFTPGDLQNMKFPMDLRYELTLSCATRLTQGFQKTTYPIKLKSVDLYGNDYSYSKEHSNNYCADDNKNYCTANMKGRGGKRAFLFEDGVCVAYANVDDRTNTDDGEQCSLEFSWWDAEYNTKYLLVEHVYLGYWSGGLVDRWKYTEYDGDKNEYIVNKESKELYVVFDI